EAEANRFDVAQMLGRPCQIQVVHNVAGNGNTYANIGALMAMPKGMTAPDHINDLKQFSIDELAIPPDLPKWVAEKIRNSREWQAKASSASAPRTESDRAFDE